VAADVLREADAVDRVLADLGGRLSDAGVHGLADLLSRDPADPALLAVSREEIAGLMERMHRIVEALASFQGRLQALRRLKERLDRPRGHRAP